MLRSEVCIAAVFVALSGAHGCSVALCGAQSCNVALGSAVQVDIECKIEGIY